ncbi:MAG TPA: NADH-quinone oxidoreductase subunit M [Vampirovibrionales bacterium]
MDQFQLPVLSALLLLTLFAAFCISLIPTKDKTSDELAEDCKRTSLFFAGLLFALSCVIYFLGFDATKSGLQLHQIITWIPNLASFELGVDGLSLSMVCLTTLLLPFVILASDSAAKKTKPKLYYSLLYLLVFSVLGVFLAQDLLLFFLFWEFELIPMYLLISIWGGENRQKAANKFLIFTFLAGALILAGVLLLYWFSGSGSFSMLEITNQLKEIQSVGLLEKSAWIFQIPFFLFLIGFCIKLPSIPVHTWLPEAHVEAPTPISMLLAGVLLKMGGYGLIRVGLDFFPELLIKYGPLLAILGAINILGAAAYCLVQDDMKRVIAYSSVSHMGFVLLGLSTYTAQGINGAVFQMFSHGVISAGLFMLIGVIYERAHTRKISAFSGLAANMPVYFFLFLGLAMANLGLPALSGFVGESLVFYSAFTSASSLGLVQVAAALSTIGVVITAGYMLWLAKRLFYGEAMPKWSKLSDLKPVEVTILGSCLGLSLLLGVYPRLLTDKTANTISIPSYALQEKALSQKPQQKEVQNIEIH